jgi:hypothetical protein
VSCFYYFIVETSCIKMKCCACCLHFRLFFTLIGQGSSFWTLRERTKIRILHFYRFAKGSMLNNPFAKGSNGTWSLAGTWVATISWWFLGEGTNYSVITRIHLGKLTYMLRCISACVIYRHWCLNAYIGIIYMYSGKFNMKFWDKIQNANTSFTLCIIYNY